jgi:triphosphatase
MSDTDAIALAGARVRAVTGLDQDQASQDNDSAEYSSASNPKQEPASPQAETQSPCEGMPAHQELQNEAAPSEVSSQAASEQTEVELKLLVDHARLANFNEASIMATNARDKGTRKRMKAIYYDSPERTLWRNGLTLRVRQSGARFVQTMKAQPAGDPLRRGEWEASVPSIAPDIALAMPFIPGKLRSELGQRGLEAVFTADIRRHLRVVDLPSGTVEVAFDQGFLRSGDRTMPVSEIELELKRGSAAAIYELALRLAEHGPVKPSIRSKAARGFDLAVDTPPPARKPRKLHLDASISLDAAFACILNSCQQHLLESLPAAEDGRDAEGIHQLRVALRRIRSAIDLMRFADSPSKLDQLRSEAKWLARGLSAARDWDIFHGKTLPTIAKGCASIKGFDTLAQFAENCRSAGYREARLALSDPRCAHFVLGLGAWIEERGWRGEVAADGLARLAEPAINFASGMLSVQHAKVLKRGRHFKSLAVEERHRLRLAVKKLRYVADFLLPLYGDRKSARRYSDKLTELQKDLGFYNDIATTGSLLVGLGVESGDSATAAAAIAGWQAHAMIGIEAHLRDAWRDFAKTKAPWLRDTEE